ncbi:anti-sigma factor [uncultured Aquimarina sp.]|uniref:anti-sigma factor n=1 Tax=uncultured Aquimarina sp. TaxID=575652 RepID=UPI0026368B6B|nr:anti-sigma factor [uncultured Aquimarina sp.]
MMKKKMMAIAAIALGVLGVSCSSDDGPPVATLTMEVVGLETLTNGATYEGWIIVDGNPISTGKFTSTANTQNFVAIASQLEDATSFVLSVEPPNDTDPGPSDTKILSGNFNGTTAEVRVTNVIGDFTSVSGEFVMASPTDTDPDNDQNGIWFMNPNGGSPVAGLNLPTLQQGWKYEGWVVINNVPVSTGTFSSLSGVDDASPYSGNQTAPDFPGEDFINNAPSPLTFPQDGDVRGKQVVISVEPNPDYDQAEPFFFKPLTGTAGQDLAPALNTLGPNGTGPFGTVTRPN